MAMGRADGLESDLIDFGSVAWRSLGEFAVAAALKAAPQEKRTLTANVRFNALLRSIIPSFSATNSSAGRPICCTATVSKLKTSHYILERLRLHSTCRVQPSVRYGIYNYQSVMRPVSRCERAGEWLILVHRHDEY